MILFLKILFLFILTPIEVGIIIAIVLRFLYERFGDPDGESEEVEAAETEPGEKSLEEDIGGESPAADPEVFIDNVDNTGNIENTDIEDSPADNAETNAPVSTISNSEVDERNPAENGDALARESSPDHSLDQGVDLAELPAGDVKSIGAEEKSPEPGDIFQNLDALPPMPEVADAVEEMVSTETDEIPEDLMSRLAEATPYDPDYEPPDTDDDVLDRFSDYGLPQYNEAFDDYSGNLSTELPEIGGSEDESLTVDGISNTAADLLGEDFDFQTLLKEASTESLAVENEASEKEPISAEVEPSAPVKTTPIHTNSPDTLGTQDGQSYLTSSTTLPKLPEGLSSGQYEIATPYSANAVEEFFVGSDQSSVAKQFTFVENSRPLFVRRHAR